jgi:hypothetical protein
MWLVKLRFAKSRANSLWARDNAPSLGKTITAAGSFTASGHRDGFDCYLFTNRSEAETFKQRVEDRKGRKSSLHGKPKAHLVEVTPEDVAHLDLDPVARKVRAAGALI